MRCTKCGGPTPPPATICSRCAGERPAPAAPAPAVEGPSVVGTMIPSKNKPALAAYYCGLFACLPYAGPVLALVAIACGIQGLRLAAARPEVRGKGHAWFGILVAIPLAALSVYLAPRAAEILGGASR